MAYRYNNYRPQKKAKEGPISVIQIDGLVSVDMILSFCLFLNMVSQIDF